MKKKYYFTFGQSHTHRVHGVTLDCDSVVEITAEDGYSARGKMFDTFDKEWSMQYSEDTVELSYFPRGIVLRLTAD